MSRIKYKLKMKANFLQLLHESHAIDEYLEKEVQSSPEEALRAKPAPRSWSAIEVIDHLNRTFELYMPRLEEAFSESGKRTDVREEAHIRASRALMVKSIAPKGSKRPFKMKTFSFFEPKEGQSVEQILQRYLDYRQQFNGYLKDARVRDIDLVVIPSAIKQLSFRIPEALKFLLCHEQRHIVQLSEALEAATVKA